MSDLALWPTMAGRSIRLSMRHVDALLISVLLPVMLMAMFVYVLGGAIRTGGTAYVTYAVPGVLVMCTSYGASLTAVSVADDLTKGVVDRFRSMDIGGRALLAGHVTASALRNLLSTTLVLAAAFAMGFRPDADLAGWLAAVGVLVAFIVAMSAISAVVGLATGSPEAASGFTFFVLFLPYPSSAFVPVDTMPGWLHGFAENQPATPVIESLRRLLLGMPVENHVWTALAWCGAILLVSVALSGVAFRRRTR